MGLTVVPLPIEGKTVFICLLRRGEAFDVTAWATQYDAWMHARNAVAGASLGLSDKERADLEALDNTDWARQLASHGLGISVEAVRVGSAEGIAAEA